jgi:DNA-binding transcriptional LysR family regulator
MSSPAAKSPFAGYASRPRSSAAVIGRSQAAVSQKMMRLEEALDLRVFERTSRSLSLATDGERALHAARQMLKHYDAFITEVRSPLAVGSLRLGISDNLVPTQLPRLLSRFSNSHPDIRLSLATGVSA